MGKAAGIVLRWGGRAMIAVAVVIVVSSFFWPDAVQPLNSVVCPEGTELANTRYAAPNAPDTGRLELVCTSATYSESAARNLIVVVGGLVGGGLIALAVSRRLLTPRFSRPDVPSRR